VTFARRNITLGAIPGPLERMPISPSSASITPTFRSQLLALPAVTSIVFDARRRIPLVTHGERGLWSIRRCEIEANKMLADDVVRERWEESSLRTHPLRAVVRSVEASASWCTHMGAEQCQ
jgi:hypothetical protein